MNDVVRGRWAGAFDNADFLCVETYSGYRGGVRDHKGKQHLLEPDVSDEILGAALLDAMAHSRFVLPARRTDVWQHPEVEFDLDLYDYKLGIERTSEWTKSLMERYGYKAKRALFKDMKFCSIDWIDDVITILPWHHEKLEAWSGDGISASDRVVIPANSTPAEIGAALRLAFSRCTG